MIDPRHPAAQVLVERTRAVASAVRAHCASSGITPTACDEDAWASDAPLPDRAVGWGRVQATLLGPEFRFSPLTIARNTLRLPAANDEQDLSAAAYLELVLTWITVDSEDTGRSRTDAWACFEETIDELGWSPEPVRLLFNVHSDALDRVVGRPTALTNDPTWAVTEVNITA